jgi:hypothetical protein
MITLTDEGRAYAKSHRESIVARVALMGEESGWPDNHVEAAIRVCNETVTKPPNVVVHDNGYDGPIEFTFPNEEQAKLGAAYLSTFTGPWGIKGSEEDALLSVLHAISPEEWPLDGGGINKLRDDPALSAFCDELYDKSCEGGDIVDLIAWMTPRLTEVLA